MKEAVKLAVVILVHNEEACVTEKSVQLQSLLRTKVAPSSNKEEQARRKVARPSPG
jgi:hypothetical protein